MANQCRYHDLPAWSSPSHCQADGQTAAWHSFSYLVHVGTHRRRCVLHSPKHRFLVSLRLYAASVNWIWTICMYVVCASYRCMYCMYLHTYIHAAIQKKYVCMYYYSTIHAKYCTFREWFEVLNTAGLGSQQHVH
jgi:hypothetical protein